MERLAVQDSVPNENPCAATSFAYTLTLPLQPMPLPESIMPLPKAGTLVNTKRTRKRKSAILTDTPEKKIIEESEKNQRKEK